MMLFVKNGDDDDILDALSYAENAFFMLGDVTDNSDVGSEKMSDGNVVGEYNNISTWGPSRCSC